MDNSENKFKVEVTYNKDFFIPLNFDQLRTEFYTNQPFKVIEQLKETAIDISATKNQIKTALISNDYSEASEIANEHNSKLWMISGARVLKRNHVGTFEIQNSFRWI